MKSQYFVFALLLTFTTAVAAFDRNARARLAPRTPGGGCNSSQFCLKPGIVGCCDLGETCYKNRCCPNTNLVDGKCCHPLFDDTCCPTGSKSRCHLSGVQYCINNEWVYKPCVNGQTCANIPVPNAGVYCQGAPPDYCKAGTPSRCLGDGVESCVGERWVFTACVPPTVCLPFPVAGAGVNCVGVPG